MEVDLQIAEDVNQKIASRVFFQVATDCFFSFMELEPKSVVFRIVSSVESQALNKQYLDKDRPTNVLAFPFQAPKIVGEDFLGDIILCEDVIICESHQQKKKPQDHLMHLTIHGLLHLIGYDHGTSAEAEKMEKFEIAIMDRLGFANPYTTIFE